MDRVVGHIDLDYFYAQVEEVENPSLKERPVIVCVFSGRTEDSGVVSTANYKARGFGVHSGMPIVQAKKKLENENPAIIRMNHEKYEVVSARIMDLVADKVDVLEPTGIDEAFFDLTNSTSGDYSAARSTAEGIKQAIFDAEKLTSSVGLGRSKVVAKLCSDMAKPGGLKVVLPAETESFLAPLPVGTLYGVGPKTNAILEEAHITTVGALAGTDVSGIEGKLGRKLAAYLVAAARGEDPDHVRGDLEPTQFSRIMTLKHDTTDPEEVITQLSEGVKQIQDKLTSSGKSFKTLTAIAILTDLSTKTRSKTFEIPVRGVDVIAENAVELFDELSTTTDREFRRVGIRVSAFSDEKDQKSLSDFLRPEG